MCDPNLPRSERTFDRQYRTECVRPPGPLTDPADTLYQGTGVGAGQEDARMGLGYINHDMTLLKNFSLGGGRNLQVRAEAYNVFNTTQYQGVNTVATFDFATGVQTNPAFGIDQRRARQFEPRDPARRPAHVLIRSHRVRRVQDGSGFLHPLSEPSNLNRESFERLNRLEPRDSPALRRFVVLAVLASCIPLMASDYLTEGNDPGRTGWMKDEKVFTLANVKDMKLLWKVKLDSQPREMHNLFSPLIAERVTTARGSREVAIVAGISDDLFGIDVASGELLWKKRYESTFAPTDKTVYHTLCLGGQTAVPAMEQVSPGKYTIYAIAWDGRLHQINAADGSDVAPPDKFLPPNGKPYALNVVNGVVYTATAQGCGGVPNALYSYHLATRKASTFIPAGGGMWGRRGAAVSPEGVVYMVTGDAISARRPRASATPSSAPGSTTTSSCSSSTTSRRRTPTGCGRAIWT